MTERFSLFDRYTELCYGITRKDATRPYDGSLALHTREDPQSILQNRRDIQRHFRLESMHMVTANQTHSDHIVAIETSRSYGWISHEDAVASCDALVTPLANVCLGILTADCVPLLLYDPVKHIIAAVHAGWRGSAKRITLKTVRFMQHRYRSNPQDILAAIGPSIRACCYEVGEDVAARFATYDKGVVRYNNRYFLDLVAINRTQLLEAGIQTTRINVSPACTACEEQRFFSYRKTQCSGRFLSFIARRTTSS